MLKQLPFALCTSNAECLLVEGTGSTSAESNIHY